MSTAAGSRPIVVGVDGSPASRVAVDWAARDASLRGVPLKLVQVLNPPVVMVFPEVPMPPGYLEWQQSEGQALLDAAKATALEAAPDLEVTTEMVSGPSIPTLVEQSRDAEMLVVGCRGRGAIARRLLGSVSSGLIHHAFGPVAVIHDEDPTIPHPAKAPVVVGVDGSPASVDALEIAFEEASLRGVDLLAVHAWSDDAVFEFPGTDWSTLQEMGRRPSASGWRAGRSAIPTSWCADWLSPTGPPIS